MALSATQNLDIATTAICTMLILIRCVYRILSRCKRHPFCHRTWHADDAYMALSLVPLAGRCICIILSFELNPSQTFEDATVEEAKARGISLEELQDYYVISHKLLIPSRIFYVLFLWCLKLCLLNFYSRFVDIYRWGKVANSALWWTIIITFFVTMIITLVECRPINLYWDPDPEDIHKCHRAMGNLVTMAVFNIITDIALIIFPFPILRHSTLTTKQKIQLSILFSIGTVVVAITILRLPLILLSSVSQASRSMWASIEILCACIVANAAFYFALVRDIQRGHDPRFSTSERTQNDLYMEQIQSKPSEPRNSDQQGSLVIHVERDFRAYSLPKS